MTLAKEQKRVAYRKTLDTLLFLYWSKCIGNGALMQRTLLNIKCYALKKQRAEHIANTSLDFRVNCCRVVQDDDCRVRLTWAQTSAACCSDSYVTNPYLHSGETSIQVKTRPEKASVKK